MNLDIAILCPGMPFDGDALTKRSLGGSETAALCMARELARLGNRVLMFNNCPNPAKYDGVSYLPATAFDQYTKFTPHDVTIVQRFLTPFADRRASKLNLVWAHDLALSRDAELVHRSKQEIHRSTTPHDVTMVQPLPTPFAHRRASEPNLLRSDDPALGRNAKRVGGAAWNIDKIAVVSEWMAARYREAYGLEDDLLFVTRNGIDLDLFTTTGEVERDPTRLIYTARPERGLDVLLQAVFPRVLRARPDAKLSIAAYDSQLPQLAQFYSEIERLIKLYSGRVQWLGHLAKPDLYRAYAASALYVYPTPSPRLKDFREVHCITALECMAAGLPFVSTKTGALPETLAEGAGLLVDLDGEPGEWPAPDLDRFAVAVVRLLDDRGARAEMGAAGRAAAAGRGWAGVAAEWQEAFGRWIDVESFQPL